MSRGPETRPETPGRPAAGRPLAWCVALALLAGCQGPSPRESDPLVGGSPLARPPAGGSVVPPPTATAGAGPTDSGGVPPLPSTHSQNSPAALAGGGMPPPAPDSGRTLRMSDGTPAVPVGNPTPGPGWSTSGTSTSSGSLLQGPEAGRLTPIAAAPTVPFNFASSGSPSALGAPGAVGASTDSYLQLQEMLRARGVTWQRLEMWGDAGEWKFRCSVPNPQNKSIGRNFEARATGEYGLAAIRAVIEEIDKAKGAQPPPR